MKGVQLHFHDLVQFTVLLHQRAVMLFLSGDNVFCKLNYKTACREKFPEDILGFSLTVDNCFESMLIFFQVAAVRPCGKQGDSIDVSLCCC